MCAFESSQKPHFLCESSFTEKKKSFVKTSKFCKPYSKGVHSRIQVPGHSSKKVYNSTHISPSLNVIKNVSKPAQKVFSAVYDCKNPAVGRYTIDGKEFLSEQSKPNVISEPLKGPRKFRNRTPKVYTAVYRCRGTKRSTIKRRSIPDDQSLLDPQIRSSVCLYKYRIHTECTKWRKKK